MNAPNSTSIEIPRTALGYGRRQRVHSASPVSFEVQIIVLCRELEKWRTECKEVVDSDPNDFPPLERKAAFQAFVFFVLFLVSSYAWPVIQVHNNPAALLSLTIALLTSVVAAPMLFVFQAIGVAKAQFWRALARIFSSPKDNYPFTPLISCIEHDCTQRKRLCPFRTSVLTAAQERMNHEESDLRERLNTFIGTPTLFVTFGVIAGSITAWQNYHAHPDSAVNAFLFFSSIGMLFIGLFGFRLRISLIELARCRSLLSFEIARRGAAREKHFQRRPPSRHRNRFIR